MITAAEIQMIRNANPGAVLPGIDTVTGNPYAASSLINLTSITQNSKAAYYYSPSKNIVYVTQAGAVLSGINFGSATVVINANNVTIKDSTFTGTTSFWAVYQSPAYSGATVENSTFQGTKSSTEGNIWIGSTLPITIKDNNFLDFANRRHRHPLRRRHRQLFLWRGIPARRPCRCDLRVGFDRADDHHQQFHRRDTERRRSRPTLTMTFG